MFDFFSPSHPPRPPLRRSPTLKDEMGRTRPERIEGAKGGGTALRRPERFFPIFRRGDFYEGGTP